LEGGGIFSNGCAVAKNNVDFSPNGICTTAVGNASGFECQQPNQASLKINYPQDVEKIMPKNPCDGDVGDVGIPVTYTKKQDVPDPVTYFRMASIASQILMYLTARTSCWKMPPFMSPILILTSGLLAAAVSPERLPIQASFASYYLVVGMSATPCPTFTSQNAQVIVFRGNGLGDLYGTILAPSACIDYRGNSDGSAIHSQIIGYNVSANGTAITTSNISKRKTAAKPNRSPSNC
jgi:hypothetical protein